MEPADEWAVVDLDSAGAIWELSSTRRVLAIKIPGQRASQERPHIFTWAEPPIPPTLAKS